MLLAKVTEGEEVVEEVGKLTQYLQSKLPDLLDFAIGVVLAILAFAIGVKLIGWFRKLVRKSLRRASVDTGVEQFVDSVLKFGLYALLIFSIGKNFGLDTTSVAAVLASGGVALGLALQGSLSNFAGGILILLLKPFVVGDYIIEDTNKCEGTVKEIQIFYTKLVTVDNRIIVLPNGTLANNSLTNLTAQDVRKLDLKVSISYDADLQKAKGVLEDLLHKEAELLQEREMQVFVSELGESAVILGLRAYVKTEDYWTVRWRVLEQVKLALDENGIEIPYQQLTVHVAETEASAEK
ncbi:MAG: mechanosensitive ion channel [Faecalimonas sp.]|nr:mechanosensitive ion channel [Faecalimonas sp.]